MFNSCAIAMMSVGVFTNGAKTLGHEHWTQKERKPRNRKMQIITHMCLWPNLQNLNLGQFGLCQWLGNASKHLRTLFESKKFKSNQIRIQNELT